MNSTFYEFINNCLLKAFPFENVSAGKYCINQTLEMLAENIYLSEDPL